jgi:hypothetical protein
MPNGYLMRLSGLNHVNRKGFTTVNSLMQGCFQSFGVQRSAIGVRHATFARRVAGVGSWLITFAPEGLEDSAHG